MPRYNPVNTERVLADRKSGMTLKEIARKHGCSDTKIGELLRKHLGITKPRNCYIDTKRVLELYDQGKHYREIAKLMDSPVQRVYDRLKLHRWDGQGSKAFDTKAVPANFEAPPGYYRAGPYSARSEDNPMGSPVFITLRRLSIQDVDLTKY